MSFYEGVKESIREENADQTTTEQDDTGDDDDMPFDELKKGADDEETEQPKDVQGDDTEIEVLTENGLEPASTQQDDVAAAAGQTQDTSAPETRQQQQDAATTTPEPAPTADTSADVATLLEDIRDQNRQIIELLQTIDRRLQE